jgi:Fe-S cluster assembly ATP-binding protein
MGSESNVMLSIRDLHARVEEKEILKGFNLDVRPGEVHAIMGPNGSGKSTLALVLAGRDDYEVTSGSVLFEGKELLELEPEDRAREGIFLAFQYPVEILGVSITNFLKTLDLGSWGGNGLYVLYIVDPQGEIIAVKQIVLQ